MEKGKMSGWKIAALVIGAIITIAAIVTGLGYFEWMYR